VDHLLRSRFPTNVRELDALLWHAMSTSTGDAIEWRDAVSTTGPVTGLVPSVPPESEHPDASEPDAPEPSAEEIRASLAVNGGNIVRAAQALGLSSRYALYRLMRKHGIEAGAARGGA
jgi:transcriptional regulator of acetoin/glycerol metabolism